MEKYGTQYDPDYEFKAAARFHQSRFRANVLKVAWEGYGNRLKDNDARELFNYFDGLGVREALRDRYSAYSKTRDADMLRSEHIPFNMFAPLRSNESLAKLVIERAFGIECETPFCLEFEYAPDKRTHLNDATAFDTFISFKNRQGIKIGLGIEVKYTEREYSIGKTEKEKVEDRESSYWQVTRNSGAFIDPAEPQLGTDAMRQIWRNHLLGLSMSRSGEVDDFYSITLFPGGNMHFQRVIPRYQSLLKDSWQKKVFGCTFEDYIKAIDGDAEILRWKQYLFDRYIIKG